MKRALVPAMAAFIAYCAPQEQKDVQPKEAVQPQTTETALATPEAEKLAPFDPRIQQILNDIFVICMHTRGYVMADTNDRLCVDMLNAGLRSGLWDSKPGAVAELPPAMHKQVLSDDPENAIRVLKAAAHDRCKDVEGDPATKAKGVCRRYGNN